MTPPDDFDFGLITACLLVVVVKIEDWCRRRWKKRS